MKKILVNVDFDHVRIAILEDDRLVEYYEKKADSDRIVGNIYKGKVRNILPGMQSAFINIGVERDAFMHVSDVYIDDDDDIEEFIDDETEDITGSENPDEATLAERGIFIEKLLKKGQDIILQVVKEPIGKKGPRATARITIPGRYTVLMPNQKHIGVSRRIKNQAERERLSLIGKELCPPDMGIILRTVAEGKDRESIEDDICFLKKRWDRLQDRIEEADPLTLVHSDLELVLKLVRDLFSVDVDELLIDSLTEYNRIIDFFDFFPEELLKRISYYGESRPLLEEYGVEKEIDSLLNRNISLRCGGYIVIEKTEALTAIDVNTGSFVGSSSDLEDTVFLTNMEAAREIARQIRLRDIGGIIILDFIDMRDVCNQEKVVEELKKECEKDRMPITVCDISPFGLVEMTRKRIKQSLLGTVTQPCPYCKGKGYVLSPQEISGKVRREIRRFARKTMKNNILVSVHPEVAFYLIGEDESNLKRMETETFKQIYIRTEKDFHIENFIIS